MPCPILALLLAPFPSTERGNGGEVGEQLMQENVSFPSGNLTLEGIWHWPAGNPPYPAVAVCHPHPLYGGDMDNNVVITICQALVQKSIAAFRFNFRGVGASQGSFGEGIGEQDDLKSALAFMAADSRVKKDSLGMAGYSFGSTVAVPVAPQVANVKALALVSPPLQGIGLKPLKSFARPKLIMCGDQDFVVSVKDLQTQIKELPQPLDCQIIPGVDHFWGGYENKLGQKIAGFFSQSLV